MDLVYPPVIGAARLFFAALGLKIDVEGAEHVPRHGPALVVSNHVSYLDFVFVGLAARPSRRYVRFLTRYDVWHSPAGPLMTGMRHIPVDRAAPAGAYLSARAALNRGEVVGIFPEAGVSRSFAVRSLMPGAVALAQETGVPIVPVAVWGPQRIATAGLPVSLRRGRPVSIEVGSPWRPTGDVGCETRAMGARLQELLDGVQRRHPDQPQPGTCAPWHPAHLGGHAPPAAQALFEADLPRWAVPPSPGPFFR
ncbi:MAG: lysophospholipid acyltransferase family protein [Nocardioidaceae bacterium]